MEYMQKTLFLATYLLAIKKYSIQYIFNQKTP